MTSWILRPIVWFATASMATTIFHELVHAIVAYAFGVRSTLHNYLVHLDLTPDQAATNIPAIIGIAGPSACLVLGSVAWVAYRRVHGSAAELPLLFFAVFGIATFFGNLTSASFAGDFSRAAIALNLPMPARYALSLTGAVVTAAVHFVAGRELMRWVPPTTGKFTGMLGIVAAPVFIGMGLVILVNMPTANPAVRLSESAFWIFAAIGAVARPGSQGRGHADRLGWPDVVALVLVIFIVRVLVPGIPFVP